MHTVAMWFFHDDPAVDEVLFYLPATPGAAPPRYDLWFTTVGGDPSLCINTGEGECWGITDAGLLGRWVHVAAVFANGASTGSTLFVDGVAANMACRFGTCDQIRVAQTPVTIGGSDTEYSWHGRIDDVRVYDHALSPLEVEAMFACAPR